MGIVVVIIIIVKCLAPEVMCRQNHSYSVDYFAVGVICYEFMLGRVSLDSIDTNYLEAL